jgi:Family of unknown function (DUF5519)
VSQSASERITEQVTTWPGVRAGPGRRGEFAVKVKGREIGHLHGGRAAHFASPRRSGASCEPEQAGAASRLARPP